MSQSRIWALQWQIQRSTETALYNFIVAYRDALFKYIKTRCHGWCNPRQMRADYEDYLKDKTFVKESHLKAVQEALKSGGQISKHPVGMACCHEVAGYEGIPLEAGMVIHHVIQWSLVA